LNEKILSIDTTYMYRQFTPWLGLFITSFVAMSQPAAAEPCLSREAMELINLRLGQLGALAFSTGTGLGLCSSDSLGVEQSVQRIDELSASAEMSLEQLSCPSSDHVATGSGSFHLVPQAAGFSSGPTKTCSCSQYKEALREARAALRSLAR
jgi:hypothetical protein